MKKYTAIKHSTQNGITIYWNNQKNSAYLRKKALDIFLNKYVLVIETSWQALGGQAATYFTVTERI